MSRQVVKGHATAALVLGVIEVVCGLIIVILSVVMASKAAVNATMSPYWAGIMFAIPGIIGIIVGCTKNYCGMIAFMVLNIIAFVLQGVSSILVGVIITVWMVIVADSSKNCWKTGPETCQCQKDDSRFTLSGVKGDCDIVSTIATIAIAVVVMLVIASIVTLSASILGCISVCCTKAPSQPGTVIVQQQNVPLVAHQPPPSYTPSAPVKY